MSVGRVCERQVDVAKPDESVRLGAQRMRDRQVGTLVVVNAGYEPVGIVTDRDLAMRVLAEGRDPLQTVLHDVMTRDPAIVSSETSLEDALRIMRAGRFRRLPIVDRAGKLSGIVSMDDILDLLSRELGEIGRLLVEEGPAGLAEEFVGPTVGSAAGA